MSGRVTEPTEPHDDIASMRERNPLVWWIAVITVVGMILGSMGAGLLLWL
jgi:hypothetical protein